MGFNEIIQTLIMKSTMKAFVTLFAAALFLGGLTSCRGVFHNENDWVMKKGAMPVYVPLQVSKRTYR